MQKDSFISISEMTAISLNLYLSKISNCWNNGDGEDLAALLSFRDNHVTNPKLQIPDPEAQVERILSYVSQHFANICLRWRGSWTRPWMRWWRLISEAAGPGTGETASRPTSASPWW